MNQIQAPPINAPFLDGKIVSNIWMMWLKSLVEFMNDTNAVAFNTNTQMITAPTIISSVVVDAEMDPSMVSAFVPSTTSDTASTSAIEPNTVMGMVNTPTISTYTATSTINDDYLTLIWMEA